MNCAGCNMPYAPHELLEDHCFRCNHKKLQEIRTVGMRCVGSYMALYHNEPESELVNALTELSKLCATNTSASQEPAKSSPESK